MKEDMIRFGGFHGNVRKSVVLWVVVQCKVWLYDDILEKHTASTFRS
jgi:hypothetical protein